MKSIYLVIAIALSFAAGCIKVSGSSSTPGTPSIPATPIVNNGIPIADENGNCSQEIIDLRNSIVFGSGSVDKKNNCDKFQKSMAEFTCTAQNLLTKVAATIDSRSLDSYCTQTNLPPSSSQTKDSDPTKNDPFNTDPYQNYYSNNKNPQCSNAIVNEVQTWSQAANKISIGSTTDKQDLVDFVDSCRRLFSLSAAGLCYVEQTELNYDKMFSRGCQAGEAELSVRSQIVIPPPTTMNPPKNESDVVTEKSKLILLPLQPNTLTAELNTNGWAYLQKGKLVKNNDLLEDGVVCKVLIDGSFKALVPKKEIVIAKIDLRNKYGENHFELISYQDHISLYCSLHKKATAYSREDYAVSSYNLTLTDLKVTLDKWFKIVKADL